MRLVQAAQGGIERGALPRAGRTGHQDHAVSAPDQRLILVELVGQEAQLLQRHVDVLLVQDAEHDLLAVDGGEAGDPQIKLAAVDGERGAAVLGTPGLGDVHVAHDLDAREHGGLLGARHDHGLLQHPVDAVTDPQPVLLRLQVNVAGLGADGAVQDRVGEAHHRRVVHVRVGHPGGARRGRIAGVVAQRVQRVVRGAERVELLVESALQLPLRRHHRGHAFAGDQPQLVGRAEVQRVHHRGDQPVLLD